LEEVEGEEYSNRVGRRLNSKGEREKVKRDSRNGGSRLKWDGKR